jgi:hypothetical protein
VLDPQTLSWLGPTAVSVVTVLSGIYATSKWVIPRIRKLGHLIDDLFGEPERHGIPARPGLMERLEDNTQRLGKLEERTKELLPNSGTSIKDAVNRIESRLANVDDRLAEVEKATR